MKKVILLIALVAVPIISYGQTIFDKLEDMDGVSSVIVSKDAFEILSKFNAESLKDNDVMEVFQMIQDLNELKMFSTDKEDVASQMETMVKSEVKNKKLIELMRFKEDKSRAWLYVDAGKNKDYVKEVLMFVKGINDKTDGFSESIVVSLTGNIDINKLSKLADTIMKEGNVNVDVKKN